MVYLIYILIKIDCDCLFLDATEILSYSDKHSDDSDKKDNDFNTNCNDAVVDDNVKSTEELIAILEDLLSEDTFEEDESDSE